MLYRALLNGRSGIVNKQKLFLDFDGVICNSIQAFCDTYNILYEDYPNFKPARWAYVEKWNFRDECPLLEGSQDEVHEIFGHNLFFKHLEFMDDLTERVIQRLCDKYQVIVCSIGTPLNIAKKTLYLRDNLPYIKEHIMLVNNGCVMDKSLVNMEGSVFIDDHVKNLDSTNAEYKIIFGDVYDWNKCSDYPRAWNWNDVDRMLL